MEEEKKPKYSVITLIVELVVLIVVIACRVMGKITTPVCIVCCLVIVIYTAKWVVDAIKAITHPDEQ